MATAKQNVSMKIAPSSEPALPLTFDTTLDPFYGRPADFAVSAGQLRQALDQVLEGEIIELEAQTSGPGITIP